MNHALSSWRFKTVSFPDTSAYGNKGLLAARAKDMHMVYFGKGILKVTSLLPRLLLAGWDDGEWNPSGKGRIFGAARKKQVSFQRLETHGSSRSFHGRNASWPLSQPGRQRKTKR